MAEKVLILWIGDDPPDELRKLFVVPRLVLKKSTLLNAKSQLQATRSVLLPYDDSEGGVPFKKKLIELREPVHLSGAALVVVLSSDDKASAAAHIVATLEENGQPTGIQTAKMSQLVALAQLCADHNAGRPRNLDLKIKGDMSLSNSDRALLERAFSDFTELELELLPGGRSRETRIWQVTGRDSKNRRLLPFVAKISSRGVIGDEIENITANVVEYVPFLHRPPLLRDRCESGLTDRILITAFVERSRRLDEYLRTEEPALAISALFDGPLRLWRRNARREGDLKLVDFYEKTGVVPKPNKLDKLQPAYVTATSGARSIRGPAELVQKLKTIPSAPADVCLSHGDLHPGNIFVRRNGTDVILIDFFAANRERPTTADPATLDVALAFDTSPRDLTIDEGEVRAAYKFPLLPPSFDSTHRRLDAVRYVRMNAATLGTSREYAISVACQMLRFASFADAPGPASSRHALAYELADQLVTSITADD